MESRHHRMRPITTNVSAELNALRERQAELQIQIATARRSGTWHVDMSRELLRINKRLKKLEQSSGDKLQSKPTF